MVRRFLATVLVSLCLPASAFCWGAEGHDLVARIALAQLSGKVRARVDAILGPDATLVSVSSWPDSIRRERPETAPWHFIDIPITEPHLDMARDCPKGDCVLQAIARFRAELKDRSTPPAQRREALMFVVHFVGDMHQPLHCSDNRDKGGNEVRVTLDRRQTNLHSAWDTGMLTRMGKEDELYPGLLKAARRNRRQWSQGTLETWAEEAHQISVDVTYGKLPVKPVAGTPNTTPIHLDAAYEQAADPVIRTQIEKAGDRLARVLNEALK